MTPFCCDLVTARVEGEGLVRLIIRDELPDYGRDVGQRRFRANRLEYVTGKNWYVDIDEKQIETVAYMTRQDYAAEQEVKRRVEEDDLRVLEAAHRFTRDYPSAAEVMEREG